MSSLRFNLKDGNPQIRKGKSANLKTKLIGNVVKPSLKNKTSKDVGFKRIYHLTRGIGISIKKVDERSNGTFIASTKNHDIINKQTMRMDFQPSRTRDQLDFLLDNKIG